MANSGVGRTKRKALRLGVRALVVAGIAGAAWLITSSTANAASADQDTAPSGALTLSPALVGDLVGGLGQDLLGEHPEHQPVLRGTTTALRRTLTPVTRTVAGLTDATSVTILPKRSRVAVPQVTPVAPVSADGVLRLVSGLLRPLGLDRSLSLEPAFTPVSGVLTSVLKPVNGVLTDTVPALTRTTSTVDKKRSVPAATPRTVQLPPVDVDRLTPVAVPSTVEFVRPVAQPHRYPRAPEAAQDSASAMTAGAGGTPGVPMQPQPTPLSAYLGLGLNGQSTSGSGAHGDGGGHATVPMAVASGSVDTHRVRKAAEVALSRRDAEAPTVSPD